MKPKYFSMIKSAHSTKNETPGINSPKNNPYSAQAKKCVSLDAKPGNIKQFQNTYCLHFLCYF